MSADALKEEIRKRYGELARAPEAGCCGPSCCGPESDPVTRDLYSDEETGGLPGEAVRASLGCGNPTALARLTPGEVVLDLGSGGGLDVLLSARRVGPTGKAYGLDMTDEMLELARANQRRAGVENAEFLKGEIENIPLPEAAVDVIISNCVVNLSGDKGRVFREAFRVLRPGGRLAISDIVTLGPVPEPVRRSMELWLGCMAGALDVEEMKRLLAEAGFEETEVEITRLYSREDAEQVMAGAAGGTSEILDQVENRFASAFVRARKPLRPAA